VLKGVKMEGSAAVIDLEEEKDREIPFKTSSRILADPFRIV